MAKTVVVNASPLIFLAHAGRVELLLLAEGDVHVPLAVVEELERHGEDDDTSRIVRATGWMTIVTPASIPDTIKSADLGRGESSVLAWAVEHSPAEVILDDLAARRLAGRLSIPFRGTLGLVLLAKRRGTIPKARPILEHLRRHGMYLSDRVLDRALAEVDE